MLPKDLIELISKAANLFKLCRIRIEFTAQLMIDGDTTYPEVIIFRQF